MADFNFHPEGPWSRAPHKKEGPDLFLKISEAGYQPLKPYRKTVKEVRPAEQQGFVHLQLLFGGVFENVPDKGFKAGVMVEVQPLGNDKYDIKLV